MRPYRATDLDAVYEICLKTGHSGKDATELFEDGNLLGHIYAGPYIKLEPESAFLLEDEKGVCGYIIGTLDTANFYKKVQTLWLPKLQQQYNKPISKQDNQTEDERLIHLIFHPEVPENFPEFPSHLHIDLLPRAQGVGFGKKMMNYFLDYLRKHGSKGVHLGLSVHNKRALRFYQKYGMKELKHTTDEIIMGLSFD